MKSGSIIAESFFDGFGPIGVFFRPHLPGGPTEPFEAEPQEHPADSVSLEPFAEVYEVGAHGDEAVVGKPGRVVEEVVVGKVAEAEYWSDDDVDAGARPEISQARERV